MLSILRQRLGAITFCVLLVAPLAISPLLGLLTPYATLLFAIPLFFVKVYRGQFAAAYRSYTPRALLLVFVVLAIICAVTAAAVPDALRAFNFTMLLVYGAISYFLAGHAEYPRKSWLGTGPLLVTNLATAGVVIGLVEILFTLLVQHLERPTGPNIGPIVLANALLALGFLGLGAGLLRRGTIDWLALVPPVLAIAAAFLTGSRGPLISIPVASIFAAVFFWRVRLNGSVRAGVLGLVAILVAGAIGTFVLARSRGASIFNIANTIVTGGAVTDHTVSERLALYQAGWQAFLSSPWIGHGWAHIVSAVLPFLHTTDASVARLPQLHNDVLDFAVAGGVVGVACYFVILTAPLIGALRSTHDRLRPFRIYGTAVIMIIYAGGGLTDLMFGFEFHTFLFVMLNAIILGYCREPQVVPGEAAAARPA